MEVLIGIVVVVCFVLGFLTERTSINDANKVTKAAQIERETAEKAMKEARLQWERAGRPSYEGRDYTPHPAKCSVCHWNLSSCLCDDDY